MEDRGQPGGREGEKHREGKERGQGKKGREKKLTNGPRRSHDSLRTTRRQVHVDLLDLLPRLERLDDSHQPLGPLFQRLERAHRPGVELAALFRLFSRLWFELIRDAQQTTRFSTSTASPSRGSTQHSRNSEDERGAHSTLGTRKMSGPAFVNYIPWAGQQRRR